MNFLFSNLSRKHCCDANNVATKCHYEGKLSICCIVSGFRNKDATFIFFCSLLSFDPSDKILTCSQTCLWNPGTYRQKIVRLSSEQFGLVMVFISKEFILTNNQLLSTAIAKDINTDY